MLTAGVLQGSVYDQQIELEAGAVADGVRRYRHMVEQAKSRDAGADLPPVARIISLWFPALTHSIKALQREACSSKPRSKGIDVWGPVIALLDAESLAAITLHGTFCRLMQLPDGCSRVSMARGIGNAVFAEIHANVLRSKRTEDWHRFVAFAKRITPRRVHRLAKTLNAENGLRSVHAEIHVGWRLLLAMLDVATLRIGDGEHVREAAGMVLSHIVKKTGAGPRKIGIVRLTTDCLALINHGLTLRESLRPMYLPMIVEPVAWQRDAANRGISGGYLRITTPLVSNITRNQRARVRSAPMAKTYDALNAVSRTAWRINHRVLAVATELAKTGGVLDLPMMDDPPFPTRPRDASKEEHDQWRRDAAAVYRARIKVKGERKRLFLTLDIAQRMADRPAIWFPHQLDYRGRAYPISSHLNHQRCDLTRGLLEFATPAPLGKHGQFWLKVAAANAYGVDKVPFLERLAWADQHADEIRRVTSDPLSNRWWHTADDPWQFLAACYALEEDSETSCVRVDGACNGLQHYAAIARDETLAQVVCLAPADAPADIYRAVLGLVKAHVAADAAAGNPKAITALPLLTRSVVKQPTMTYTYNVTRHGAAAQIAQHLTAIGNVAERHSVAQYLTTLVLRYIAELGPAAKRILDWILGCARTMMAVPNPKPIEWTTPLGFPVYQPHIKQRTTQIRAFNSRITLMTQNDECPAVPRGQVNAIGPNLIHSLDAAHMMMTASACWSERMPFAAVHDSFWTTAGQMHQLCAILRHEFVRLHDQDPIMQWHEQQVARTGITLPPPPARGSFDLTRVLSSPYFFA